MASKSPSKQTKTKKNTFHETAGILKLLAHPLRLEMVHRLLDGPMGVGQLRELTDRPQSTVSQQLALLRMHGILLAERKANRIFYSIADTQIKRIVRAALGSVKSRQAGKK